MYKMKTRIITILFLFSSSVIGARAASVYFKVTDENNNPVGSAEVHVSFMTGNPWDPKCKMPKSPGKTDSRGLWKYSRFARKLPPANVAVTAPGYYKSSLLNLERYKKQTKQTGQKDDPVVIILKRMEQPIPMYARFAEIVLPNVSGRFGYDLVFGDLIAPSGKGQVADFVITVQTNASSRQLQLDVTFSNPSAGIQVFLSGDRYAVRSELRSPHLVPEDDYHPSLSQAELAVPKPTGTERADRINYFFRVRGTDKDRPLFGKVYGGFQAGLQGGRHPTISFTYYLNPTGSNNMEFDPDQNLARKTDRDHLPYNP